MIPITFHDAALAEMGDGGLEGRVTENVPVAEQFRAIIIERRLVVLHALRPVAGAEVDQNLSIEPALDGQGIVRPPFVGAARPLAEAATTVANSRSRGGSELAATGGIADLLRRAGSRGTCARAGRRACAGAALGRCAARRRELIVAPRSVVRVSAMVLLLEPSARSRRSSARAPRSSARAPKPQTRPSRTPPAAFLRSPPQSHHLVRLPGSGTARDRIHGPGGVPTDGDQAEISG